MIRDNLNLIYNSDMLPDSTKQMMQRSLPFKLSFGLALALVITVIVLGIVSTSVRCNQYTYYYNCYQVSGYYYYQCYNGVTYCCSTYNPPYCGDSYSCRTLSSFNYYRTVPCWGVLIAMWVCSTLCFFLAIFTIVLFCSFRRKIKQQIMIQNLANAPRVNYANPVAPIYYANPGAIVINPSEEASSEQNRRLLE